MLWNVIQTSWFNEPVCVILTKNISDIDECSLGIHKCHAQASCINTNGSYFCECLVGHSGDGKMCKGKFMWVLQKLWMHPLAYHASRRLFWLGLPGRSMAFFLGREEANNLMACVQLFFCGQLGQFMSLNRIFSLSKLSAFCYHLQRPYQSQAFCYNMRETSSFETQILYLFWISSLPMMFLISIL